MIHKICRYATSIKRYGLSAFVKQALIQHKKHLFARKTRKIALLQKNTLSKVGYDKLSTMLPFEILVLKFKENQTFNHIFQSNEFKTSLPCQFLDSKWVIDQANLIVKNNFLIFGKTVKFANSQIEWQTDFINKSNFIPNWKNPNCAQDQMLFYADIKVLNQNQNEPYEYFPDIKVPWELSRLNHFFILGFAYQLTKDEIYSDVFCKQLDDWIEKNRFLFGVNWVCPMDIAIRSINIIWGLHFFKNSLLVTDNFWKKVINSLYEHAIYIKNNFERDFKPHNHYLSNLIGYLYLCNFFYVIDKFKKELSWCEDEILKEFNRQIHLDNTNYEGSTSYHKLVCEIFFHFYLISSKSKFSKKLPTLFIEKLGNMFEFLNYCSSQNYFVQIGDNDSGKILASLNTNNNPLKLKNLNSLKNYNDFGLSIIIKNGFHITFRHPSYKRTQPSGHFHKDELSITLFLDENPILVDPGTYCYSSNSIVRNFFRGNNSHNSFFIKDNENKFNKLFELPLIEQKSNFSTQETESKIIISSQNLEYLNLNLITKRILELNLVNNHLTIKDIFTKNSQVSNEIELFWNFIFHPSIMLEKDNSCWLIKNNSNLLAKLYTNLDLQNEDTFYSQGYGEIIKCIKLVACAKLTDLNSTEFSFQKI